MGYYLGKQQSVARSIIAPRHGRRPSYTHTAAPVLGPRAATPGVAANPGPSVDVRVFYWYIPSAQTCKLERTTVPYSKRTALHAANPVQYSTLVK